MNIDQLKDGLINLGYDLIDNKGFKLYVTKWINDSASFTVASITRTNPHLWSVNYAYHHTLRPHEQKELTNLLNRYATMGE